MPRRSKLPPNKTIIEVVVDKALAEKLRNIAYEIYGERKGALSYTVEEALKTFVKLYENKQVSINRIQYKELKGAASRHGAVAP